MFFTFQAIVAVIVADIQPADRAYWDLWFEVQWRLLRTFSIGVAGFVVVLLGVFGLTLFITGGECDRTGGMY